MRDRTNLKEIMAISGNDQKSKFRECPGKTKPTNQPKIQTFEPMSNEKE